MKYGAARARSWLPILVGGVGVAATCLVWHAQKTNEKAHVARGLELETRNIQIAVQDLLKTRMRDMGRMARRWEHRGGTPRSEWQKDAEIYVQDLVGFQKILWIDPGFREIWSVSAYGERAEEAPELSLDDDIRASLESLRTRRSAEIVRTVDRTPDEPSFWIGHPLHVGDRFEGFLVAIVSCRRFLQPIMTAALWSGYDMTIRQHGGEVLSGNSDARRISLSRNVPLEVPGARWRLRVWPTDRLLDETRSAMPLLAFSLGIVIALLLATTVHFHLVARGRARDLAEANPKLELEITERRSAEERIQRYATELERSNQELSRFASVASHDLKAPLRSIDNLAAWFAEGAKDVLSEESRRDLEILRSRVQRMGRLLDDLLEYSRAGRLPKKPEAVEAKDVVRETIELLDVPPGFEIECAPDLPTLRTHRYPLAQVFQNLLDNAIKHHDRPNGHVSVTWRDLGASIEFIVSDDGPGIPPGAHERVFRMFQTLEPSDRAVGTGMGLALVKKLVESYGESIRLQAGNGRGSSFQFTWHRELGDARVGLERNQVAAI